MTLISTDRLSARPSSLPALDSNVYPGYANAPWMGCKSTAGQRPGPSGYNARKYVADKCSCEEGNPAHCTTKAGVQDVRQDATVLTPSRRPCAASISNRNLRGLGSVGAAMRSGRGYRMTLAMHQKWKGCCTMEPFSITAAAWLLFLPEDTKAFDHGGFLCALIMFLVWFLS